MIHTATVSVEHDGGQIGGSYDLVSEAEFYFAQIVLSLYDRVVCMEDAGHHLSFLSVPGEMP